MNYTNRSYDCAVVLMVVRTAILMKIHNCPACELSNVEQVSKYGIARNISKPLRSQYL